MAVALTAGMSPAGSAQTAPTQDDKWLPDVSLSVFASRSVFHEPYRGDYRTDLAPLFALSASQRIGGDFAGTLGLQLVDQRVTGLGPELQYRFRYLEVPATLSFSLGRLGALRPAIHGGGVVGIPLRCRAQSAVPAGTEASLGCGETPVGVEKQRVQLSLRGGGSLRTRVGSTWLGLTAGIQHGVRDVFGNARITSLIAGLEIGR